ncbi:MAG: TonB-dependent receptor [Bacteroidia bacterium]
MKIHSTIVFLLISFYCFSQKTISGKISNSNKEPLPFSTIEILSYKDSSLVNVISADSVGGFSFKTNSSSFCLRISLIGYKQLFKTLEIDTMLKEVVINEFVMETDSNFLNEVVVSSEKKTIEKKIDRIVFNVDNSIASIAGNALELLARSPMIRFTNEQLTIIGKSGVRIMVNGHLSPLSGEDLTNFLRSIPANEVVKIEVITNPSSKYDASGNSGLINVVTRKIKLIGTNGIISTAYTQAFYPTGEIGGSINHRNSKINLFGNANYRNGSVRPIENMTINYPLSSLEQKDTRKKQSEFINASGGIDYSPNNKSTIGLLYSGVLADINIVDQVNSENRSQNSGAIDSIINTNANTTSKLNSHTINLNYIRQLDSLGKSINIDLDFLNYNNSRARDFNSLTYNALMAINSSDFRKENSSKQLINVGTLKFDFDCPMKFFNLSTGFKLTAIKNSSDNLFYNVINSSKYLDSSQTNSFEYNENTSALYINANKAFSKLELQLGLRGEYTQTIGNSKTLNASNKNEYLKLFPTCYFLYKINDNNSLSLSYGKRINRPNYNDLNPFKFYLTPNNYAEGNPFLKPSYSHNAEFGYTLKNEYVFTAFYQKEVNYFSQVPYINPSNDGVAYLNKNIGSLESYGVYTIIPYKLKNYWRGNVTLYYYNYQVKSELNFLTNSAQQVFTADFSNQFIFGKNGKFSIDASAYVMPPGMREGIYKLGQMYVVNIGFRMALMKKAAFLTISANDIFMLSSPTAETSSNNVRVLNKNTYDTRNVKISFMYKFGNKVLRGKRQRDNGNLDEKNRLKN